MIASWTLHLLSITMLFGLPDLLFEMHPCGLHVCYTKNMGQFRFFQTVHDNMKLFSKCQIVKANKAKDLDFSLVLQFQNYC